MVATAYPLPRSARRSDILAGNGTAEYGPFGDGWGIFDIADVAVWVKLDGEAVFAAQDGFTVTRTDPSAAYGTFSVTLADTLSADDELYVEGSRLHERSLAVSRGGQIDSLALEKELSMTAVVLQEQHRDIGEAQAAIAGAASDLAAFEAAQGIVNGVQDGLITGLRSDVTAVQGDVAVLQGGILSNGTLDVTNVPVIASMAVLQALTGGFTPVLLWLQSFTSGLRDGGGYWAHDATDTTSAHDGLTVAVDAAGRRWKPISMSRANRPHEVIDLEYFLSRYSDHRTALINAHKALFIDTAKVPSLLECHGIQLQINQPVLLRYADLGMDATEQKAEKVVANLHVKAVDGAYTWQTRDFLYSIAGRAGSGDLRFFTLDQPLVNMNTKSLIGIHVSGYYHVTMNRPVVRDLGNTGIGIYSSKYDTVGPGVGKPAGSPVDNGNHGIQIVQPDVRGTFGLAGGDQTGIFLEDGDADISGGWLSFLDKGLVVRRGGVNTEGVHFSMGDRTNMTIGIQVDAPRQCSFNGDELDGSCILFQNPTDNMWSEGTSLTTWQQLSVRGQKHAGRTPGGVTAGFGFINFKTITAAEKINALSLYPDWVSLSGGTIDVVKFLTSGAGSWDGPGFNHVVCSVPHNNNMDIGTFPTGVRLRLAKSQSYGLVFDPSNGANYLLGTGQSGDPPFIRPNGKALEFGRDIAGVATVRWKIDEAGGDWIPQGDGIADIGENGARIANLWMAGACRVPSRLATAVAGAATLDGATGIVTTEALTTAAGGVYTLTLTNSSIGGNDIVLVTVAEGTSTGGQPLVGKVQPGGGSCVIRILNLHASAAFNGTLLIGFSVLRVS